MSHESSVNPNDPITDSSYSLENRLGRANSKKKNEEIKKTTIEKKDNKMIRPQTPHKLTHYEDFEDE